MCEGSVLNYTTHMSIIQNTTFYTFAVDTMILSFRGGSTNPFRRICCKRSVNEGSVCGEFCVCAFQVIQNDLVENLQPVAGHNTRYNVPHTSMK